MVKDIQLHDSINRPHSRKIYRRLRAASRWSPLMALCRRINEEVNKAKPKSHKTITQRAEVLLHWSDL